MALLHWTTVQRVLMGATTAQRVLPTDWEALRLQRLREGRPFYPGVTFKWDVSADCTKPGELDVTGREYRHEGGKLRYWIMLTVPCRSHCDNCRRRLAAHWRFRAKAEWAAANRTWFSTLTFTEDEQMRYLNSARASEDRNGSDFDALGPDEQFRLLCCHKVSHRPKVLCGAGHEVTNYIKRLRKNTRCSFRYLAVAEQHKSGRPHYHLLVHETGNEIKHRQLKENWTAGFSDFKLALEERQVTYLCKYITKELLARVRASNFYGQPSNDSLTLDTKSQRE